MPRIGLRNIHYAVLTEDTTEALAYSAIKEIPGAITANVTPNVNTQELYADDQLWESDSALGAVDVALEIADLPLEIRAELTGATLNLDGVLVEKADDAPPYIALGFASLKSTGKYQYVWLLKGRARPFSDEYETRKENVEHKTPTLDFHFMPRRKDAEWRHMADEDQNDFTDAATWFDAVPGAD